MSAVSAFYNSVINEVIESLKVQFNEEGVDTASLEDLKELWNKKINDSRALDPIIKPAQIPQTSQFTAMMQQNGGQGNMAGRINTINNAGARLIKPSGQGTIINEQGFPGGRVTLPIYQMHSGNSYRGNTMVPMVINANQQQGVTLFGQYHNIVPNQGNITHIIPDNNGIVNLRKNQTDGADDKSSDEDEFVNVSEADPQSVRTPYLKKELKQEDSDEDISDDIGVINNSSIHPSKAEDSDDDDDEVDDDKEKDDSKKEDSLNSNDDISDDDPEKIFETENVIVCQYDKVSRTRNKWKLNFVSGIANLYGKDTVFHKAVGEAEW